MLLLVFSFFLVTHCRHTIDLVDSWLRQGMRHPCYSKELEECPPTATISHISRECYWEVKRLSLEIVNIENSDVWSPMHLNKNVFKTMLIISTQSYGYYYQNFNKLLYNFSFAAIISKRLIISRRNYRTSGKLKFKVYCLLNFIRKFSFCDSEL